MADIDPEQLREPWSPVAAEHMAPLEAELAAEVSSQHPLYGRAARALARRSDQDDVLFALDGLSEFAVVHLTYSSRPERYPWPSTEIYPSVADFISARMVPDHQEYAAGAV